MEGYAGVLSAGFMVALAVLLRTIRRDLKWRSLLFGFGAVLLVGYLLVKTDLSHFIGFVGLGFLVLTAYFLSSARSQVRWRTVAWGLGLQFIFALIVLKTEFGRQLFAGFNDVIVLFLNSAQAGASFVFGNLSQMTAPVMKTLPDGGMIESSQYVAKTGAIFAFSVVPTIIFFASFMAVLYHLGIMERVIKVIAGFMQKTMGTSGAESMSAGANIFFGQTEAPLVVRPYINSMTRSELMAIMTAGFATVAGSVMAAFVGFLVTGIPTIAGHLLAASIMSAPAALVMAKLFVPETEVPKTMGGVDVKVEKTDYNVIDAAVRGASEGMRLSLNIVAMVIAFLGIIALVNAFLGWFGTMVALPELSLALIFGKIFAPFAFLLGVEWADCAKMGHLIGTKLMANEFLAFLDLKSLVDGGEISTRTSIIASYALCGFANLSSIGIQIGALGTIAPDKRGVLSSLGLRAMVAGVFASFSTACLASILL